MIASNSTNLEYFLLVANSLCSLSLLVMLWALFRVRPTLINTTLISAWNWLLASCLLWMSIWFGEVLSNVFSDLLAQQLWYLSAIMMLCPLVAVLGAKRPGIRDWSLFILSPLVIVLWWPALTLWRWQNDGVLLPVFPVEIELPHAIGYLLVLLMGAGNYFGTRYTIPILLYAISAFLLLGSYSVDVAILTAHKDAVLRIATLLYTASLIVAILLTRQPASTQQTEQPAEFPKLLQQRFQPWNRLWNEYANLYGIVWEKRFRDRYNQMCRQYNLEVELQHDGLHVTSEAVTDDRVATIMERVEHNFRWLLRRFVDASWIERQLKNL